MQVVDIYINIYTPAMQVGRLRQREVRLPEHVGGDDPYLSYFICVKQPSMLILLL